MAVVRVQPPPQHFTGRSPTQLEAPPRHHQHAPDSPQPHHQGGAGPESSPRRTAGAPPQSQLPCTGGPWPHHLRAIRAKRGRTTSGTGCSHCQCRTPAAAASLAPLHAGRRRKSSPLAASPRRSWPPPPSSGCPPPPHTHTQLRAPRRADPRSGQGTPGSGPPATRCRERRPCRRGPSSETRRPRPTEAAGEKGRWPRRRHPREPLE
jgi:hypothetical protein